MTKARSARTTKRSSAIKKAAKKKASAKKTAAKKKASAKKKTAKKTAAKKTAAKKTTAKKTASATRSTRTRAEALREQLIAYANAYPGAHEDYPWGEVVTKVRKKVFVFHGARDSLDRGVGFSVKLPHSGALVLGQPFATPTGYGLGRAGWVSVRVLPDEAPPLEVMKSWIDESYRAVAPKRLIAELDARG